MNRYILLALMISILAMHNISCISLNSKSDSINTKDCVLYHNDTVPSLQLRLAVSKGNIETIKCLLQKGVDAISLDDKGETALMYACKEDTINFEIVSLLLENGNGILFESSEGANSALKICIDSSKYNLCQFLLSKLSLQERHTLSSDGFYLIYSIAASEPKIVKQLIPFQVDLMMNEKAGSLFLERAINKAVILDDLLMTKHEWKEKKEINFDAALEVISLLLSNGVSLNENDKFSAIVIQAFKGASVIEFLVKQGLDLNKPLEFHSETSSIFDLFLLQIANKKMMNLQGKDVDLTQSEELEKYIEVLDLMIAKGIKNPTPNISPYNQLAIKTVEKNNLKLMALLLTEGKVDIDFVDPEGRTLLMIAQEFEYKDMVNFLKSKIN